MTYPSWTLLLLFPTACSCAAKIIDPESLFILPSFNRKRFYSLASLSPLFRNWPCNPLFFQLCIFSSFFASFERTYISSFLSSVPQATLNSYDSLSLTYETNPELYVATVQLYELLCTFLLYSNAYFPGWNLLVQC